LRVGLLGGSGLVGRDLVEAAASFGVDVVVFSRTGCLAGPVRSYQSLPQASDLDVLVNLIGGHKDENFISTIDLQLEIDSAASEWSARHERHYVFMSSGAIFDSPGRPVNNATSRLTGHEVSPYVSLKIHIEDLHARQRALGIMVTDFRLFSFAGKNFIAGGDYFLSKLHAAGKAGSVFQVKGADFIRDYVGPPEIWAAVVELVKGSSAGAFNLFSQAPATRQEVFEIFTSAFTELRLMPEERPDLPRVFYCANADQKLPGYCPQTSANAIRRSLETLES